MRRPSAGPAAATGVDRRTVLEWLGSSAVLALGADLLSACSPPSAVARYPDPDAGLPGRDGRTDGPPPDTSGGALDGATDAPLEAAPDVQPDQAPCGPDGGAGLPFEPGTLDPARPEWAVNTVESPDLPSILASWRLRVDGLCAQPLSFTFGDLMCLPRTDQLTDFHCVEGWSVYDVPWNGVHLQHLLDLVAPSAQASHVTFHTMDGVYVESHPLSVALEPRTLLGYGVNGHTLPLEHGFPLRVVVPRLFGYKNIKHVARIELASAPVDGYWVQRGYPRQGEVPPIRLRDGKY